MFNHISWASYFEAVALLLVIYYLYVGIRFYHADLISLFNGSPAGRDTKSPERPEALQPNTAEPLVFDVTDSDVYVPDNYPDADIRETDNLIAEAKSLIQAAANKAYGPESLINRLRELFTRYPSLRNSPHRPAINELVVSECERTGVAELTEDEVDQWWRD